MTSPPTSENQLWGSNEIVGVKVLLNSTELTISLSQSYIYKIRHLEGNLDVLLYFLISQRKKLRVKKGVSLHLLVSESRPKPGSFCLPT